MDFSDLCCKVRAVGLMSRSEESMWRLLRHCPVLLLEPSVKGSRHIGHMSCDSIYMKFPELHTKYGSVVAGGRRTMGSDCP
jgi:hypothetical protein